jgi:DNA modification methylase
MQRVDIFCGDCLEVLRTLPDSSVDAVVTDPPYGLAFMGKRWDYDVPSVEVWAECLRVLKPGGHLLAFAGTRTQHRMAVRIEDAGFEIRDMIAWVYGSGFPKSLDVSKAIDKCNGQPDRLHKFTAWMRTTGLTARQLNEITDTDMGGHYLTAASQPAIPTAALWELIRPHCRDVPAWADELVDRIEAEREIVGSSENGIAGGTGKHAGQEAAYGFGAEYDITAPATPAAKKWSGWGTALKPAMEPITVARKPLIGTVAANVLEHGTGALNVDGCRVATDPEVDDPRLGGAGTWSSDKMAKNVYEGGYAGDRVGSSPLGRWPANFIHDGSEDVVALFPDSKGQQGDVRGSEPSKTGDANCYGEFGRVPFSSRNDTGSAARFFYCAKASKKDRGDDNKHPTVKPTDLMRYLCRLVTPPNGTILDPFTGSGSTGKAAMLEGFQFIGIEREAEYVEIAKARIEAARKIKCSELTLGE